MDVLERARSFINQRSEAVNQPEGTSRECDTDDCRCEISERRVCEEPVDRLRQWLDAGHLATLPEPIPGFTDELAPYADRTRMIGLVRAILDAVPWSLTALDRAEQFVRVLAPLIEQG